jgi:bacteriorhodopsin
MCISLVYIVKFYLCFNTVYVLFTSLLVGHEQEKCVQSRYLTATLSYISLFLLVSYFHFQA